MRVIRAADQVRMPWKNGGGVTTEIAVHPAGAAIDAFDWRISRALVARDGPFSAFPGIDRSLAVISGAGIDLELPDGTRRVVRDGPALAFAADAPCFGRLLDGGIEDLNVMTRRGRVGNRLERRTGGDLPAAEPGEFSRLFLAAGPGTITVGRETAELGPMDAVLWDAADGPGSAGGTGWLVRILGAGAG